MCYVSSMKHVSEKSHKSGAAARDSRSGQFVQLKDGRKLVVPPSGGALTKRAIREAVTAVAAQRSKSA